MLAGLIVCVVILHSCELSGSEAPTELVLHVKKIAAALVSCEVWLYVSPFTYGNFHVPFLVTQILSEHSVSYLVKLHPDLTAI